MAFRWEDFFYGLQPWNWGKMISSGQAAYEAMQNGEITQEELENMTQEDIVNKFGNGQKGFLESLWNDFTGKSNTEAQNSAAAALQEDAQAHASSEAQIQRDWLTDMSNTAHQREVADLQAAGLNPWLSAGGGQGASSGAAVNATAGIGSAQASNVNLMQSLGTTAVGLAALIKVLKSV